VIRYALAPVVSAAASSLALPRTVASADGVVVTFDDGPHPDGTPAVLDVLARAGARAMFFVIGEQVERRPATAASIVEAGHLVAVHGYRHSLQLRLSASAVAEDIARAAAVIADATGVAPKYHRPPFGIYSPAGLQAAREAGLQPLLWSRCGKDWRKFTTAERIAKRAVRNLRSGDVILLHDADFYSARGSHERTVAALPDVLETLAVRGFDTVLPV
jgi:peptidoglycan/xylan/chitin deacetylase (PgdA/CDA1 family)